MENKIEMIDKNEVKKDLYKSKKMANFSHYVSGNMYYNVILSSGELYQFPIPVVENITEDKIVDAGDDMTKVETVVVGVKLSEDLGTTTFYGGMKGSELNRWISKAIDNGEFIKIQ